MKSPGRGHESRDAVGCSSGAEISLEVLFVLTYSQATQTYQPRPIIQDPLHFALIILNVAHSYIVALSVDSQSCGCILHWAVFLDVGYFSSFLPIAPTNQELSTPC